MARNGTKMEVAVLKSDMNWIRDKLITIDNKLDNIQLCTKGHDIRIQTLEDAVKNKKEEGEMSRKTLAIVISLIVLGINVCFWVVEHFVGV